jgi:transcriptional regulator with XRE-family HTH domain
VEDADKILIKALGRSKARNLTQAKLSDLADMEESALRRIELGGTNPTFTTLLKVCGGLEITLSELFDFSAS